VWLKVDTGMHRLGFLPAEVPAIWQRLTSCPLVKQAPRLMTHLANADDLHDSTSQKQIERFNAVLPGATALRSVANSAGILGWLGSHSDIDRPGILLYGVSPFKQETGCDRRLYPVMTLKSELIAIKACRQGDAVGYGGSWRCPQDMTVGVVAIGYGDGYPRHAPSGTPVLVNGQRVPLIGRVSMDMICVDLHSLSEAQLGDEVVLWGEGLPAEEVASAAGTIAYELFCGVTNRVPRRYLHGEVLNG
jgi:alanine racemase